MKPNKKTTIAIITLVLAILMCIIITAAPLITGYVTAIKGSTPQTAATGKLASITLSKFTTQTSGFSITFDKIVSADTNKPSYLATPAKISIKNFKDFGAKDKGWTAKGSTPSVKFNTLDMTPCPTSFPCYVIFEDSIDLYINQITAKELGTLTVTNLKKYVAPTTSTGSSGSGGGGSGTKPASSTQSTTSCKTISLLGKQYLEVPLNSVDTYVTAKSITSCPGNDPKTCWIEYISISQCSKGKTFTSSEIIKDTTIINRLNQIRDANYATRL